MIVLDLEILKENIVDFVMFSYYMLLVLLYDENNLMLMIGNMIVGGKNLYLLVMEWGWIVDLVGLRILLL